MKEYNVNIPDVYQFFSRTLILQSERYGTLAKRSQGVPEYMSTGSTQVIRAAIK
ncbi:hypothetical protein H6G76_02025 [Nostoc sp. FACHB-152]|uniref:hypothetical protein n=1 Tax=unclassified Nostoc TaxID=2593658 RepID=UPI001682EDCD|nr:MULTISPECIES: hypothetical protein [unclassified Nostoc]MBD2445950.1 hypothetical protein [Nostoc sp. FACHB-152]MBD2467874.1 hypothetical protein [Nostoc sp. FACHB-145]